MSLELTNIAVFASTTGKINIGFGTVTFNGGLQVRINIRKSHAGSEFVSWPQSSYVKDGKTVYVNEVTLLKEVSEDINDQIIAEFNKVLAIGPTDSAPKAAAPKADPAPKGTGGSAATKPKPKVKNNW